MLSIDVNQTISIVRGKEHMNQEEQREKSRRHFFIVMWVLCCVLAWVLINKKDFNKPADITKTAEYQQGYKDALYKRPVSEELDLVCAGLWIGQEDLKYQQREMKK